MTPEQEIAALRAELAQTSVRLQRVEAAQQTVHADHESTSRELRDLIRTAGDDLTARNDDDRKRLRDEVRADVAELRAQVDHLARAMRRMDGSPAVDLEPDAALIVLAQRVEQGLRLAAGRLDDGAREANVAAARAWEAWELDAERHRGTALDAGAEIVATPPGRARRAAESRFRSARRALAELAAGRDEVRGAADVARRRLADDDEWLRRHGPDITAGRDARAELGDRYRQRIDAMIATDGLPPGWFTAALGRPAGDAEAWRAAAVDVLVYRAVFAVIDPVAALGRAPDDEASPQRRAWYADLSARLMARGPS